MIKYRNAWLPLLGLAAVVGACESSQSGGADDNAGMSARGGGGSSSGAGTTHGGTATGGANSSGGSAGTSAHAGTAGADATGAGGKPDAQAGSGGLPEAGSSGTAGGTNNGGEAQGGGAQGGEAQGGEAGTFQGDAGSAGAGADGHEFAYVSLIIGGVLACSVDLNTGNTTQLPGSPVNSTGSAANIAVHPNQQFVYVADERKHIDTYRVAADGSLPAQPTASVPTAGNLIALAVHPTGIFVYAASSQNQEIYAFEVIFASGELLPIGDPLKVGVGPNFDHPAFLAVDPSGQFLYASLQAETGFRGYRINQATGVLHELDGSPFATTGLPDGDTLFGGGIVFKPSGDFMYTSGGGLNAFSIDPTSGKPTLVAGSPFTLDIQSDRNAPNIAMDPLGKYVYATHFLLTQSISGFKILPSGGLEPVPNMPFQGDNPYSISVDPTGRFVFVGVDGPTMAAYRITRSTGFLTPVAGSEFQFGGFEPKIVFASSH